VPFLNLLQLSGLRCGLSAGAIRSSRPPHPMCWCTCQDDPEALDMTVEAWEVCSVRPGGCASGQRAWHFCSPLWARRAGRRAERHARNRRLPIAARPDLKARPLKVAQLVVGKGRGPCFRIAQACGLYIASFDPTVNG